MYGTTERGVNMCTRFVYNGNDTVVGFNFDIDLSVWTHTVITEKDRFFIGIKMPDNQYHSFHGVNRSGNVGTLLYVSPAVLPPIPPRRRISRQRRPP